MKNIYLILLLLCTYRVGTQTIVIKDQETGGPLAAVTLSSQSPKAFVISNWEGKAEIAAFRGSDQIQIRALGYTAITKSFAELESISFELSLSPAQLSLDGVVVLATRWNQSTGDLPSKTATISGREVALQNPQTAADLLSVSGKVFIQKSQQGGGSPMIRGFATNRLLYAVDGVRMNTAIFRGGNLQQVISLDPFAIERTEVLFGPGSVIYGSDAIGGVMSFQTLTPQLSPDSEPLISGKTVGRYASANEERTGHFDIQVGWKKWAMVTSLTSNDFGDLRMGSFGPDEYLRPFFVQRIDDTDVVVTNDDPRLQRPSGYSQINMMQKVRFCPDTRWDIQYGFHYSETSAYSRYDRHIRYRNGEPRYGEWSYGPQKWRMNHLNATHTAQNGIYDQAAMRLAHQFFEESRISRDINKSNREVRTEKVDAWSANLDFVKSMNARNKLFYGVEVVGNDVVSEGINEDIAAETSAPGPSRYPNADWASLGLYISDQFTVSNKFLVSAGLRYSAFRLGADFDTTFYPFPFTTANLNDGAFSGSLGFVFRPTKEWVVSANAATAFRSPNVDDVGKVFDSEPGSVTVPNPDLKSEYAYNADMSIARIFGNVLKIDLTGYYTKLNQALVRRDFMLNGLDSIIYDGVLSQIQAIQNAAVAQVYGIQAGMEVKLPHGFGISADLNYQKGEETLDDGTTSPARHAPPFFGMARLMYQTQKLTMQLYTVFSGERTFDGLPEEEKGKPEIYAIDENGNPFSPGWYTLNFKAIIQFAPQFSVSAGLENLTDQRYRPYSSGIVAPGRNFMLSTRFIF